MTYIFPDLLPGRAEFLREMCERAVRATITARLSSVAKSLRDGLSSASAAGELNFDDLKPEAEQENKPTTTQEARPRARKRQGSKG
jgi:hypothetical protein